MCVWCWVATKHIQNRYCRTLSNFESIYASAIHVKLYTMHANSVRPANGKLFNDHETWYLLTWYISSELLCALLFWTIDLRYFYVCYFINRLERYIILHKEQESCLELWTTTHSTDRIQPQNYSMIKTLETLGIWSSYAKVILQASFLIWGVSGRPQPEY